MGLKEISVEAYQNEKERIRKESLQEAEKFVAQAEDILRKRIGNGFTIQVISKEPSETVFFADDIRFRVDLHGVYIIKTCLKCGTEYYEDLAINFGDQNKVFQDIGRILLQSHNYYDCQRVLKEKEGNKEPTTEEKLLQALKDFIQENMGEY